MTSHLEGCDPNHKASGSQSVAPQTRSTIITWKPNRTASFQAFPTPELLNQIPRMGASRVLVSPEVKESACNAETLVQSLGQEDPLEREMATHSSVLAWRIPWTQGPVGLWSMGFKESDTTKQLTHTHTTRETTQVSYNGNNVHKLQHIQTVEYHVAPRIADVHIKPKRQRHS